MKMPINVYFDPTFIKSIGGKYLVLDNNVLTSLVSNADYFETFSKLFSNNPFLLDPIINLEFLRTAYQKEIFEGKSKFLKLDKFNAMPDHQEIYKKIMSNALKIAQIQSKNGHGKTPLGDILIMARLMLCSSDHLFVTLDKDDFTTLLFDRLGVISFEKLTDHKETVLEHISILSFNAKKFKICFDELPNRDSLK